ncbi:MAG: FAD-binding oxidoreductase [Chloroflexota bacterium]
MMFDYLVVGNGMIGAAAGRYLSEQSAKVALVGPDEPKNWATHQGVFASHYDQGRITRILDSRLAWGEWAKASIAVYEDIEQRSGIRFYYPVGLVQAGPEGDYITAVSTVGKQLEATFTASTAEQFKSIYPALQFPAHCQCLLETGTAGYVNPRSLVAAQLKLATQQGATVIRQTVTAVQPTATHVNVQTDHGQTLQARKVLIAAGAYSNRLLEQKQPFILKPRTILLAEVSDSELERLANLPSIIYYDGALHKDVEGIYMLPPIRYPNGRYYLKIGGDLKGLVSPDSDEALLDWFHGQGNQREADGLRDVMEMIVPNLKADRFEQRPCVVTYTPDRYPLLDTILADQIYIAAGGCGAAAKSSNEIGRLAAMKVMAAD